MAATPAAPTEAWKLDAAPVTMGLAVGFMTIPVPDAKPEER